MIRFFKKYAILLFFIYISVWTSLAATPLIELFRPPLRVSRMYSLLLYVPFAVLVLWKLIGDIRGFRKNAVNVLYYILAAYYGALCVYRFVTGGELKESLYYAVVFFGSVALYCQIRDDRLHMDRILYKKNFTAILIFMCAYKIIASALCVGWFGKPRLIGNTPINNLYSTSMLVLLVPFMLEGLKNKKKAFTLEWVLLCISFILIYLCSSRAIVLLATGYIAVCVLLYINNSKMLIKVFSCAISAVLIIALLATFNVGRVRYSLYREIGLFRPTTSSNNDTTTATTTPSTQETIEPDATEPDTTEPTKHPGSTGTLNAGDADVQIERSDSLRSALMREGLKQVKKNPLFGTGDLYYTQDLGYMKQELTSHNFLIETTVCFGLIGLALIAVMVIAILLETKFLSKTFFVGLKNRIAALMVMLYYFGFGMVQPSVYNTLICPLFLLVISYFGTLFANEQGKDTQKQITGDLNGAEE